MGRDRSVRKVIACTGHGARVFFFAGGAGHFCVQMVRFLLRGRRRRARQTNSAPSAVTDPKSTTMATPTRATLQIFGSGARPFSLRPGRRRTRDSARAFLDVCGGAINRLLADLALALKAARGEVAASGDRNDLRGDLDGRLGQLEALEREHEAYAADLRDEIGGGDSGGGDGGGGDSGGGAIVMYLGPYADVLNRLHRRLRRPRRKRKARDFLRYDDPAHMKERSKEERKTAKRMKSAYHGALVERERLEAQNAALLAEVRRLRRREGSAAGSAAAALVN